jgi:hypothetical protein
LWMIIIFCIFSLLFFICLSNYVSIRMVPFPPCHAFWRGGGLQLNVFLSTLFLLLCNWVLGLLLFLLQDSLCKCAIMELMVASKLASILSKSNLAVSKPLLQGHNVVTFHQLP